jgi:hypothetical protein
MMSFTKPSNVCLTRARLALSPTARRQRGPSAWSSLFSPFIFKKEVGGRQPACQPADFLRGVVGGSAHTKLAGSCRGSWQGSWQVSECTERKRECGQNRAKPVRQARESVREFVEKHSERPNMRNLKTGQTS